ncbi:MAG: hypothetical protein JW927_05340 [Deltaproteobacteria bacterium]|nr:hypothetical protein [Deltaproteobacteria bacterium]
MAKLTARVFWVLIFCFLTVFLSTATHADIPSINSINPAQGTVTSSLDVEITGTGFDANTRVSMYMDSGNKRKQVGFLDFLANISITGLAISGNYAYISAQTDDAGALYVVDISNPSDPQITGTEPIPAPAKDISISGNYVYLTADDSDDTNSGLYIVNVSDPSSPEISSYAPISNANKLVVSDNNAYVAVDNAYYTVNVADPLNPVASGPVTIIPPEDYIFSINELSISGGYIYIVGRQRTPDNIFGGTTTLYIINLSDPASQVSLNICDVFFSTYSDIDISGDTAYITSVDYLDSIYNYYAGNIYVVNISDPSNPSVTGNMVIPGAPSDIYVSGSTAYVAEVNGALHAIDIIVPSNLEIIGTFKSDGGVNVSIFGNYAYITGQQALMVFGISNPEEVQVTESIDTPGSAGNTVISGDYAYVADGYSGLQIINISNPLDLQIAGSSLTSDLAYDVSVSGDTAYVFDRNYSKLQMVDISNPTNPQLGESINLSSIAYPASGSNGSITAKNNYLYIGRSNYSPQRGSLNIIDINNPLSPVIVGSLEIDIISYVSKIIISGNYTIISGYKYVDSNYVYTLCVINISNPASPQPIGSIVTPYYMYDITVSGNYIYTVGTGFQTIDISNPSNPIMVGTVPTTLNAKGIVVSGNYAYVSVFGKGLYMIDINDPANPVLIGSVDTPGLANDVFISGGYGFISDGDNGIVRVPLPVEVSPVTVDNANTISATLPGPTVQGYYTLKVFNDEGSDELFGSVRYDYSDQDDDGIPDYIEDSTCTDIIDTDSDDDGIPDGVEDANKNGVVDAGETNPCDSDTDGDGIQDGTELGYTLAQIGPDTATGVFIPDLDPSTTTNPINEDSDGDNLTDGEEDKNHNGRLDSGETNPCDTDTDNDGRSDSTEVNDASYPTDPTDPDSDDDGVNDGLEVNSWTNPLDTGDYPAHGTITGTIHDSTGSLITGTSIEVTAYYSTSSCSTSSIMATAMSDPVTGIFTITGLPANDYYIKAMDSSSNYATEYYNADPDDPSNWNCNEGVLVTVNSGETKNAVDFKLGPGATITGRVTDSETGLGVVDMRIYAYNEQCNPSYSWSAVTDYRGNYTFTGLPAGEAVYLRSITTIFGFSGSGFYWHFFDYISVWHDGSYAYLCNGVNPVVLEKENIIDFELEVGSTIEGKVTDQETGLGIANAFVMVYTDQCDGQALHYGIASSDGDYTIKGLPPGELFYVKVIQASKGEIIDNSYVTTYFVNEFYDDIRIDLCDGAIPVSAPSSGIDFELEAGGSIKGRVTDSETGMGISNIYVEVWTAQCGGTQLNFDIIVATNFEGYYTLQGLPTGESYYIKTKQSSSTSSDYIHEWYGGAGVDTCDGAVPVVVSSTNIDFVLQQDTDGDGIYDSIENAGCLDSSDADTDDDGIPDGVEDANKNGVVDSGETDPCDSDTDGDGIQDGTEKGYTLSDIGPDTNTTYFKPDLDPSTKTNPLNTNSDGDSLTDGEEDKNYNGRVDTGETNPNDKNSPEDFPWELFYPAFMKKQ